MENSQNENNSTSNQRNQPIYRQLNFDFNTRILSPQIFSGQLLYSMRHPTASPHILIDNNTAAAVIHLYRINRQTMTNEEPELHSPSLSNLQDTQSSHSGIDQDHCRICRFSRPTEELIACPCKCTGSVGFVHINCLRRWIRFRNDDRCEICHDMYNIPREPRNYWKLFLNFFQMKYFGTLMRYVINLSAVTPIVYFSINQVIQIMDKFNDHDTFKLVVLGPALLLATSLYFFLYFDWAISCLSNMQKIISYWWSFGDQDDDEFEAISYDEIQLFGFPY